MTRAEENKVRNLVHGFLHSDITAEEFREELDRITGRNTSRRPEELPLIQWGLPLDCPFRAELL